MLIQIQRKNQRKNPEQKKNIKRREQGRSYKNINNVFFHLIEESLSAEIDSRLN